MELTLRRYLVELCEGVMIAQIENNLKVEKDLYNLLISILRSPETIMKITNKGSK